MLQNTAGRWVHLSFWAFCQGLAFCRGEHATELGERPLWTFWISSLRLSAGQKSHSLRCFVSNMIHNQIFWNIWINVGLFLGQTFFSHFLKRDYMCGQYEHESCPWYSYQSVSCPELLFQCSIREIRTPLPVALTPVVCTDERPGGMKVCSPRQHHSC